MSSSSGTIVPQNNSVKTQDAELIYFEGDFYSRDQIREIVQTRKKLSKARAYQRAYNKKRKPILMFGLNTTKA